MPLKPSMVTPYGDRRYEVRVDEGKKIQPHQVTESEAFMGREFTTDIKRNFEYIADNNLHHRYMDETINNPYVGSRSVNSVGGACRDIGVSSLFGDSSNTNYMFQKFNREQLPLEGSRGGQQGGYMPNIQMASVDNGYTHGGGGLSSQIANTIAQLAGGAGAPMPQNGAPQMNMGPRVPGPKPMIPNMRTAASPDSMRQNRQGLFVPGAQFQQQAQAQHRTAPVQDEQAVIDQIRRNRESIMQKMQPNQKLANKNTSQNDYEEI